MPPNNHILHCALLSANPSPFPSGRSVWRRLVLCASSEPVLRWKRTLMTRIKRIFTDSFIRAYPCHPCNPRSIIASFFAAAPEIRNAINIQLAQITNLRSSAFIRGLFFAEARDINCYVFIKVYASQNSCALLSRRPASCAGSGNEPVPYRFRSSKGISIIAQQYPKEAL